MAKWSDHVVSRRNVSGAASSSAPSGAASSSTPSQSNAIGSDDFDWKNFVPSDLQLDVVFSAPCKRADCVTRFSYGSLFSCGTEKSIAAGKNGSLDLPGLGPIVSLT